MKLSYRDRRRASRAYWKELAEKKTGLKRITKRQYAEAVRAGFTSDGCTFCSDRIFGIRMGTQELTFEGLSEYPCLLHDLRFFLGGGRQQFEGANLEFYQGQMAKVQKLWQPFREFAEGRCHARYIAVSSPIGFSHFNASR